VSIQKKEEEERIGDATNQNSRNDKKEQVTQVLN
jgi:hypothetical protein